MRNKKAFTLLELLLVVAMIAILAAIVIVAINPNKQLGETNNAKRNSDVNTILNAVYQYAIDNNGELPTSILISSNCAGVTTHEVCKTGESCIGITDLSLITASEKYLVSIPTDPTGATSNGAGYHIVQNANKRVTVCAPDAQESATISVTK